MHVERPHEQSLCSDVCYVCRSSRLFLLTSVFASRQQQRRKPWHLNLTLLERRRVNQYVGLFIGNFHENRVDHNSRGVDVQTIASVSVVLDIHARNTAQNINNMLCEDSPHVRTQQVVDKNNGWHVSLHVSAFCAAI